MTAVEAAAPTTRQGNEHGSAAARLVSELIAEFGNYTDISSLIASARNENWIPGFVRAGKDRSLYFSQKGERIVRRLSSVLKSEDPKLSRSHTDAEWHGLVRAALGPAFAWIEDNPTDENHAEAILRLVRNAVTRSSPRLRAEISVGARLLDSPAISSLIVGPVRFESREIWLENRVTSGNVTRATANRIFRSWAGEIVRKRKDALHSHNERDILDTVGDFAHVCSITSTGLAMDAARARSLTAARLALVAISLAWANPSYCLERMALKTDVGVRHQHALRLTPGELSFADRWLKGLPIGPHLSHAEWDDLASKYADVWHACGQVLSYYLTSEVETTRPTVTTALLHALLWFYEGCCQELDFLSVVYFSACMDALANGEDKPGIRRLISARVGYRDTDPIFVDGPSMSKLVDEIYSDGRSKLIHGSNLNLRSDWRSVRERSEKLARMCLISCLSWGATNPMNGSPKELQR